MSYKSVSVSATDEALRGRVQACVVEQQLARGDSYAEPAATGAVLWHVVNADDVEAAYESALAGENPDPGGDPSVITDGMILANVQPNLPPATGGTA